MKYIKISRYNLKDIFSGNKILFNVNNIGSQPDDYLKKLQDCYTRNWIKLFHDDCMSIQFSNNDMNWILSAFEIGSVTGLVPKSFNEELETMNTNLGGDYFVRSDRVSLKTGIHGVGPYNNLKHVVESVITSEQKHAPFKDKSNNILYFLPWLPMNRDREFRVFVYKNKITAVSVQHLYEVNTWLNSLNDQDISSVVHSLCTYFELNIKDKMAWLENYVMDIYYFDNENWYFIEVNPFGAQYSSGSSLYHWILDNEKLTNDDFVEIRYVSNE